MSGIQIPSGALAKEEKIKMTINEQTLQELAKQFGLALDWSNNNIIPYLQDLAQRVIIYEFRSSIFWIVIGAIFILVGAVTLFLAIRDDDGWFIITIFTWMIGLLIIGKQINDIILCGTLPEKILLNYIQSN